MKLRKHRRLGNLPPTPAEAARIVAAKEGPCVACLVRFDNKEMAWRYIESGCDYNHAKSGNIRRGHAYGFALCIWHHRGHPMQNLSIEGTRKVYGPSLMDGSALFHRTYGSDDDLIELQTKELA